MEAAHLPAVSEPAKSQVLRPMAMGRMWRADACLCRASPCSLRSDPHRRARSAIFGSDRRPQHPPAIFPGRTSVATHALGSANTLLTVTYGRKPGNRWAFSRRRGMLHGSSHRQSVRDFTATLTSAEPRSAGLYRDHHAPITPYGSNEEPLFHAKGSPPTRRGQVGGFRRCPATGCRVTALIGRLRGCMSYRPSLADAGLPCSFDLLHSLHSFDGSASTTTGAGLRHRHRAGSPVALPCAHRRPMLRREAPAGPPPAGPNP